MPTISVDYVADDPALHNHFSCNVIKLICGSFDDGTAHSRGGPSYFGLGQSNQNRVIRNASLPHGALAHKSGKTAGRNLFAGLTCRFITIHAKSCYAFSHFTGQPFFRISPEAVLLAEENVINVFIVSAGVCDRPCTAF